MRRKLLRHPTSQGSPARTGLFLHCFGLTGSRKSTSDPFILLYSWIWLIIIVRLSQDEPDEGGSRLEGLFFLDLFPFQLIYPYHLACSYYETLCH
jgi:hypothetical protein